MFKEKICFGAKMHFSVISIHKLVTSLLIGVFLIFLIIFPATDRYTKINSLGMCFCQAHNYVYAKYYLFSQENICMY